MTSPLPMDQLDQRGRAAAHNLRQQAGERPRPAFDPDHLPSPAPGLDSSGRLMPRPVLAIASAAAVIVALLGLGLWAGARNDDQGPATRVNSTAIRPYLAASLPDGLTLAGVAAIGEPGDPVPQPAMGALHTFGPAADDPQLGILVTTGDLGDPGSPATPVTVGNRTGHLMDLSQSGMSRILEVPTGEGDAPHLWFISPGLSPDELIGIASATTFEGFAPTVAPAALPDRWQPQAVLASGMDAISPISTVRDESVGQSYLAMFGGSSPGRYLLVSVSREPELIDAGRLVLTQTSQTEVRGHRAVIGHWNADQGDDLMATWVLRWEERPGEVVTVAGLGLSPDEVKAAAASLEPVEPARWSELLEATALGDLRPDWGQSSEGPTTELGRGRFEDGTAWVLRVGDRGSGPMSADLQLDVAVSADSESISGFASSESAISGSDGQPAPVFGTTSTLEKGGRVFAAGLVSSDVARVEILDSGGNPLTTPAMVEGDTHTAWVTELTGNEATIQAYAADGTVLGDTELPAGSDPGPVSKFVGPTTTGG